MQPLTGGESIGGVIAVDIVIIVVSFVLLILRLATKFLVGTSLSFKFQSSEEEPKPIRCHIIVPLILMVISFLLGHSVYHFIQVICFTFLFAKWSLSSDDSHSLLSQSQKTAYGIWLVIDYLLWSSSRFWSRYLTDKVLGDTLSASKLVWAKLLLIAAYTTLLFVPSEQKIKTVNHNSVKSKAQANFENRVRIIRVLYGWFFLFILSLYHFVNSPVGIFVQNVMIIIWIFMYPSILTMILLLISTVNMVLVSARKIEEAVIISPKQWTQNLLIMYVSFISLI